MNRQTIKSGLIKAIGLGVLGLAIASSGNLKDKYSQKNQNLNKDYLELKTAYPEATREEYDAFQKKFGEVKPFLLEDCDTETRRKLENSENLSTLEKIELMRPYAEAVKAGSAITQIYQPR